MSSGIIHRKRLQELSRLSGWRSAGTVFLVIATVTATIFLFQTLIPASLRWWLYPIALVIIGSRQHAMGVLVHEGVHYRLFPSRFWNEVIGESLLAWPLGFTQAGFRRIHLSHHRHNWTPRDPDLIRKWGNPDWSFPRPPGQVLKTLILDFLMLKSFQLFRRNQGIHHWEKQQEFREPAVTKIRRSLQIIYYLLFVLLFSFCGLWNEYFWFWLLPALTWAKTVRRLRAYADHYGLPKSATMMARNTELNFLGSFLIMPLHVNLHLVHHLHSEVPWYNLKKLHHELLKSPDYRRQAIETRGLQALFTEFANPQTLEHPLANGAS